jgi:hypothetical protein
MLKMPDCQWSIIVYTRTDNDLVIDANSKPEIQRCPRAAKWIIWTSPPGLAREAALACTEHVGYLLRDESLFVNRVEHAAAYLGPGGFIEEHFHAESI